MLVASWLRRLRERHLWLQLDEADGDVATFFHYLTLAAETLPSKKARLPAFTFEFLTAPGSFARLFFRALFSTGRPPAVIVLDDYHAIRADSPLHAALRDGFSELPRGAMVVVLSRSEPPAAMARQYANGAVEVIRSEELTLTDRESNAIAGLWGYSERDRDTVRALHARAKGWAAGFVLLLAGWRPAHGRQARGDQEQVLFDYFAQEVLEGCDPDTQRVLLETSLLPRIDGAHAAEVTRVARAQEILAGLLRRGHFVTRQANGYQYHPLFQDFLLGRAVRALPQERQAEVRRTAAMLLEKAGQIEDAVGLYLQANAWDDSVRLIRERVPRLFREGRAETVARWVFALPDELRGKDPWLLLALGQAQVLADLPRALLHLKQAFDLFLSSGIGPGAYLAWGAIAEVHMVTFQLSNLDEWLRALDELRARFPDVGGPEIEARVVAVAFGAMSMRQPENPSLASLEARALHLALSPGDPYSRLKLGQYLLIYYGGCVFDLAKARLVADTLRPLVTDHADPTTAITWHLSDAIHHMHLGHRPDCLEAVERGLAISSESGLRNLDCLLVQQRFFARLPDADLVAAEADLKLLDACRLAGGATEAYIFHHCAVLLARRRRDPSMAREHARVCQESHRRERMAGGQHPPLPPLRARRSAGGARKKPPGDLCEVPRLQEPLRPGVLPPLARPAGVAARRRGARGGAAP